MKQVKVFIIKYSFLKCVATENTMTIHFKQEWGKIAIIENSKHTSVIGNYNCTVFGNWECTENGNKDAQFSLLKVD